jgi:hypothetical protein
MTWLRVVSVAALATVAAVSAASAGEAVDAYRRALTKVCQTQVTPELVRQYQAALKELEAAGEGFGRGSNFAGLRDPYLAYNDCWQLPGVLSR